MPKKQTLYDLFEYAGGDWSRAVIAGGYAVEPTKALDVDLWIPEATIDRNFERRADAILTNLDERKIAYVPNLCPYPNEAGDRFLVATIEEGYDGKNVQLLITSHKTPQALIDSFDISTH